MSQLTPDEIKCATRCRNLWEEAVITYQLDEDVKFILKFKNKLEIARTVTHDELARKQRVSHHTVGLAHVNYDTKTATITLNRDAIAQNPADMLEDTIPHELAHIVCMLAPHNGDDHNEGWQAVCKRLGGTGSPTYSNDKYDLRLNRHARYVYDVPGMGRRRISHVKHKDLQEGNVQYRDSVSGLIILKEHWTGEIE